MSLFSFGQSSTAGAPAGQSAPATTPSFSFGNQQQASSTAPNAASTTGAAGGLFGSQPAAPNNSSGTTSLFGAKPAGTSLFGAGAASGGTNNAPTAGGLFGSSTTQSAPGAQPGTSSFSSGNPTANQQQQQPSGSSLFGQTGSNQQPFGQSSGLFGQQSTQPAAQQSNSLFGGFQSTNQQQQQQQQQPSTSLFNSTSNYQGLGQSTLGQSTANPNINIFELRPKNKTISERLQVIANRLTPGHPEYVYQDYAYNVVPAPEPGKRHINFFGMTEAKYESAQRNNPDRERLVPFDLKGEESIAARVSQQTEQANALREKVLTPLASALPAAYQNLTSELELSQTRESSNASAIQIALVRLVAQIARLSVLLRGQDLSSAEERMHQQLRDVLREYNDAGNGGRMQGKLGELWAVVARIRAMIESNGGKRLGARDGVEGGGSGLSEWNEAMFYELEKVLSIQTKEISSLVNLEKDQKVDLGIMEKGMPMYRS